ncbi:response regulator transcription factor [Halostella pelagica]|uniref:response regulator transcription factor n=1 Tax=Halostella pelagica TaxID=2583824 RepID=UPI00108154F0|nr:response regulator [Halostella pelagica]
MAESGERTGERTTVLVADDEPKVADLYAQYLDSEFDIRTAYSGSEALELADGVDVVLLDRQMPDKSGDDVLNELRDSGNNCQVVMVTALEPTMDVVDMQFDDYVVKPAQKDDLIAVVEAQVVRATYDTRFREYLRLKSKIDVLREEMDSEELVESDRFEMLTVLAESLYDDLREMIEEHDSLDDDAGPEELVEP